MPIGGEEAQALLDALDSGSLSEEEQNQAAVLLDEYATAQTNPQVDTRGPVFRSVDAQKDYAKRYKGVAKNVAVGLTQIPASLVSAVALGTDAVGLTTGDFDEMQRQRREQASAMLGDSEPMPIVQKMAEFGGGLPLTVPSKSAALLPVLKSVTANAGIGVATSIDRNASVAEATQSGALGLLVGVGLPATISSVDWARTGIPRLWVNHVNKGGDADQASSVAELLGQFPQLSDWLTLGQRSGSQAMVQTEARLAGNYALEAYKRQAEILRDALRQYGERYGAQFADLVSGVNKLSGGRAQMVVRSAVSALAKIRSLEYNSMLNSAEAAVTAEKIAIPGVRGAAQIPIEMSGFRTQLVSLMEDFGVTAKTLGAGPARMLNELETFKGNMSLETFVKTLRELNTENFTAARGLGGDQERAFAQRFKDLMFSTVDNMDESHDAFTWLKRASASYKERSGQVEALRNSAVAGALGLKVEKADPGSALVAFVNKGRAEQAQLRELLSRRVEDGGDPQLLNEVRGLVWKEALRTAERESGGMTKASFDPLKAADNLMQLVGTKGDEFSGLFSKAEADQIREAVANVRAIDVRLRGAGQAAEPEKVAMSFTNWGTAASKPFIMQQLWRFVMRTDVEQLLFTAHGRDILKNAAAVADPQKAAQILARGGAAIYGELAGVGDRYANDGTDSQ